MSSSSSNIDTSLMSLEDYIESVRIPIEKIKSGSNNLANEYLVIQNSLSENPSTIIIKGRLMQSSGEVNIVVRMTQLQIVFNEIIMLKDLRHKNIVPLFKFTETGHDNKQAMIITKHEANESLDKHLSSTSTLSWMKRLHICVGIARALCYLHYDTTKDHSVIHGNIKSSKILLDHDWEPKLHGFGFAVRAKKNQLYLIDEYKGSLIYMDPAYETTRGLTNKSDVFSFGVVLFEVLLGMEASVLSSTPGHKDHWYFARMARSSYEEKTLDEKIDPDLRKQMNLESLNIFSETAYFCLEEQRPQRLHMKKVLQRLERASELQYKYDQSLEHREVILSNDFKVKVLDHLRIPLSDIRLATNNFSDTYRIGSGGYGTVYKAKLGNIASISSSTSTKRKNGAEFLEKHITVAIKRLFRRVDGQAEQGFLAEIELLSKCKNQNIVSLIGFCHEETEMILIYEYATNESLEAYLGKSDKISNLTWPQRIKICINIAYGLEYLHTPTEDKECIIHRDIKSANILLNEKWEAKIADFGLSKLHPTHDQRSTFISSNIGGTEVYIDPEYLKTGKLKTQSDIYSFGVVLFEIMSGNLAYDKMYNTTSLPSTARQCVNDKTIQKLVDPQLKEAGETFYGLTDGGLNQDSLYTFSKVASQCVAKAQVDRPTMAFIIEELEKSLNLQNNIADNLQISLEAIKLGTQNFSESKCIGKGRFWRLYEGEISLAKTNGCTAIVAKRFDSRSEEGNSQFLRELKVLFVRKHNNIVALVGYCNEMSEKIVVYEHTSNGTLNKHLDNVDLTWMKRLQIGLDIARVLEYLHTGGITKDTPIIHRDIKSSSILLDVVWRPKISNFEVFSNAMEQKKAKHIEDDNAYGSLSYLDPRYKERGFLDQGSDRYSLGVVLLEMLLGRVACAEKFEGPSRSLVRLGKRLYEMDFLDQMIFEGIKKQISPRSLDVYSAITFKCLENYGHSRPGSSELVEQLTLALAYQEDYEIWEPKLPKDCEKLCKMSKTKFVFPGKEISDRFSREPERIKNFYDLLCKGFLFQEGKAWFSLAGNRKRNVMISARLFSYTDRSVRKWQSISESRFRVSAQMLDISNLKIRIKIKPQLLLAGKNYGVYLVFKLLKPKKCLSKHMYVNLKYKWESNNLHANFATWREDGWMMIELCQILNYKQDTEFEVLLESFSRSYCGRTAYIEGIEFRTLDNEYQQQGLKDIVKCEVTQKYEDIKGILLEEVKNEKICFILSEMKAGPYMLTEVESDPYISWLQEFYYFRYETRSNLWFIIPASESRFGSEIELQKQQVFGIQGKIESQTLSQDTNYTCYLVFRLSGKRDGLHCPVKVRHGLEWKNKEIGLISFRPPLIPWNLPDTNGAPRERDDGCMEVIVWKFNSNSDLKNDHIPMNLKFITYEGTMSGLILCGLEIRSM